MFARLIFFALLFLGAVGAKTTVERWETVPVPANANPHVSDGCFDVSAKKHANGEHYERAADGKFKYACVEGVERVVACRGSERAKKAWIAVGETLEVNGFWHKCQSFPNTSAVYSQEFSCKHKDKEYKVGEVVNLGFLRLKCEQDGYKVEGCFSLDANNDVVSTAHDESNGKRRTACKDQPPRPAAAAGGGCVKRGKLYKEGDTLDDFQIKYKCTRGGVLEPIGCFTNTNRTLAVGEDAVEADRIHRCYKLGDQIKYKEYGCGHSGEPRCVPPKPIVTQPASAVDSAVDEAAVVPGGGFGRVRLTRP